MVAAALAAAAVVAAVLVAVGNYLKVVLMIQRLYFSPVKNLFEKWLARDFETTDGHRWTQMENHRERTFRIGSK